MCIFFFNLVKEKVGNTKKQEKEKKTYIPTCIKFEITVFEIIASVNVFF